MEKVVVPGSEENTTVEMWRKVEMKSADMAAINKTVADEADKWK